VPLVRDGQGGLLDRLDDAAVIRRSRIAARVMRTASGRRSGSRSSFRSKCANTVTLDTPAAAAAALARWAGIAI
jgi:hypothetical protein